MIDGNAFTSGLSLRPSATGDQAFLHELYFASRPDLQLIDGERDLREHVIEQQYQALAVGAGTHYPNAMNFIVEKAATRIGGVIVDFGDNEVRIIYLAFIEVARGHGYGKEVLRGLQQAAERVRCPLAVVVWRNNTFAKQVYLDLGFRVEESQLVAERMVWYPSSLQSQMSTPQFCV